ncbi:MAG: hypothetical protein PF440_08625 [Thiomicrorhabdus sp.]|jgi:hypothetical protein|nr:hypothetical protein [Thiomicrorhabdus sp.]
MKREDLEKLVQGFTDDDSKVDWDKVAEGVNKELNDVVAKQQDKAKDEARKEFFKTFEVENVEDLAKQLDEANTTKDTLTQKQGELTELERKVALYGQGITDPDRVDYILFNVNKRVNDEVGFEDAFKQYKEDKPDLFKKEPITINKRKQGDPPPTDEPGYRTKLKEKHPDLD